MARKKKNVFVKKSKRKLFFLFFFFLLLLFFLFFFLEYRLYELQREERLLKVKDYTSYTLSYQKQNRCQKREVFSKENTHYYYDCLDNVYLTYGSVETTLEEVILNDLLSLDVLLSRMQKWDSEIEGITEYTKASTNVSMGYKILVDERDEQTKIFLSAYESL